MFFISYIELSLIDNRLTLLLSVTISGFIIVNWMFKIRSDFDIWYFIFVYLKVVLKMIHNVLKAAFSWWGWVYEVQNKVQAEWGNYSCPIVVRHPVLWEAVAGFTKCPHHVQYLIWYNTAGRHFFQSFLWTKVDNQISCEIYGICGLFYPLKNIDLR